MDNNGFRGVSRRNFLQGAGSAGLTAVAGCLGDDSDDGSSGNGQTPPGTGKEPNGKETIDDEDIPDRYLLDIVPSEDSRDDSIVFDNHSTDFEFDRYEVDLNQLEDLRNERTASIVENEWADRDWEEWLESITEPDMLQDLKKLGRYPDDGFDHDIVNDSEVLDELLYHVPEFCRIRIGVDDGDSTGVNIVPDDFPNYTAMVEEAVVEEVGLDGVNVFQHPVYVSDRIEERTGYDDLERFPMLIGFDENNSESFIIRPTQVLRGIEEDEDSRGIGSKQMEFFQRLVSEFGYPDSNDRSEFRNTLEHVQPEHSVLLPYFGKEEYNQIQAEFGMDWAELNDYHENAVTVLDWADASTATEIWHPLRFGGYETDERFFPEDYFKTPDRLPGDFDEFGDPEALGKWPEDPEKDEDGEVVSPDDWTEKPRPWEPPTYEDVGLDYEEAARLAGTTFRRLAAFNTDFVDQITNYVDETSDVAMTRQYLRSVIDEIRTGGTNVGLQELEDQAIVLHNLLEEGEDRYIVAGTAEEPEYIRVEPEARPLINDVWSDEEGEYDNLVDELEPVG